MFALVNKSDNSITKFFNGNKGITVDGIKHPQAIFTLWSEAERNAINIYTVEIDESKRKNPRWYINTSVTYSFDGSKAKGSYGDATALAHADTTWTSQDKTDGKIPDGQDVGDVAIEGLKTKLIRQLKSDVKNELAKTDWYITRKAEKDTAIPSSISTHRDAVRSKQSSMETSITNASDTPALETLYTYVNTADEGEKPVFERPIGELPYLE
tara:strand:- start:39 stop:674 length:636 start_codon:yes stop_codon:yes gene_type:complete